MSSGFTFDLPLNKGRSRFDLRRPLGSTELVIEKTTNESLLLKSLGELERTHYLSRTDVHLPEGMEYALGWMGYGSLGMQAIHNAFAAHIPLTLGPDLLWYMISHEVAICVKQNTRRYAHLFNGDPDNKKTIEVRDDSLEYQGGSDWLGSINLIRDPLREAMSERTISLFTPRFSTSTPESETAILVAFMDVISSYYQLKWSSLCGIPRIRLEGTAEDWQKLTLGAQALKDEFPDLKDYFNDLIPVLRDIAETVRTGKVDESFWRSIYKRNEDSGGPYISGWITAFTAYLSTEKGSVMKERFNWRKIANDFDGMTTDQFPMHVSRVPFIWDYYGTNYDMTFAAGIFGVDFQDGFLAPRLGFGVFEPKQQNK